ncbi:FadR/GntR family transcriptional regulator [Caballeronia novacaledonica]|uniref:FadR family transcriptional regulator n=1 Tax=Caballeronia novacaledonica TaxID=1544861 RepID=A0AA37IN28_9BURK|nr:FadR/GntR family transcriptional regulator [Caballeronia novacaledonica]GJH29375.1 FadR family transcriptional regulator [Caballeronia novacaledonica]
MNKIDRSGSKISHRIIEELRERILTGKFPNDSKLPAERELAEEFGVSQPTIREAIRALDAMGLLDVRHGSGTYVNHNRMFMVATALQALLQLDAVTLAQALDVRRILGGHSVALAAEIATEADIRRIESSLQMLETLDDIDSIEAVVRRMVDFQVVISEASRNPLLSMIEKLLIVLLLEVQMRALRHRGVAYWKSRSLRFQSDRKRIVEAMTRRDRAEATRAMEGYFQHQLEEFLRDPELVKMCFSDEEVINAVSEILVNLRRNGGTVAE